ncbi:EamA family transporter [Adhaeribacter pallidiroseus]|uniref:Putative inner membrane transporter n=1 Tax=Adhaeribacter pallidiroseus TaxID=2072847 RepID=A0A369QRL2_9BACT|nr:EamA family transporter [Adhaeribacter pallidiroseus]RDC66305.1 putative inner membrane transporter [Adhaeribacter pallidiroseus]
MAKTTKVPRWLVLVAFANIYLVWGSTYLAIVFGLDGIPPFILSFMRFLTAGVILFVWCLFKGEPLPTRRNFGLNAACGSFMLVGGSGLVTWAEQFISSGSAAILIATEPFWFVLLDKKCWSTYFSHKLIIWGLIIGFAGVILFFILPGKASLMSGSEEHLIAYLVLLGSSVLWVVGSLLSKNTGDQKDSTVMTTAQQLMAAGAVSFVISLFTQEWPSFSLAEVTVKAWGGLAFLIIMGSLVAYLSFIWLISVRPPALVSTHTYINPVVAVLLGGLFAAENITLGQVAALGIILAGVLLTNIPGYKKQLTTSK